MLIGDVWITQGAANGLATLLDVHRTTVQRWIERRELPKAVYLVLLFLQNGDLGQLHDTWAGWSIDTRRGDLVSPAGECFGPGYIMGVQYRLHQVAHLRGQVRELKEQTTSTFNAAISDLRSAKHR